MANWYEVQEGKETVHVRATNTRTAFDKGFRLLCGMNYKLLPGTAITLTCLRLRGGTEKVKLFERVYQDARKEATGFRRAERAEAEQASRRMLSPNP